MPATKLIPSLGVSDIDRSRDFYRRFFGLEVADSYDDEGRMMVIICHNTDLGDGWEREGVDNGYFREYSEKFAYPMGINIVTYAMTH